MEISVPENSNYVVDTLSAFYYSGMILTCGCCKSRGRDISIPVREILGAPPHCSSPLCVTFSDLVIFAKERKSLIFQVKKGNSFSIKRSNGDVSLLFPKSVFYHKEHKSFFVVSHSETGEIIRSNIVCEVAEMNPLEKLEISQNPFIETEMLVYLNGLVKREFFV
jgi:hypothetical protein